MEKSVMITLIIVSGIVLLAGFGFFALSPLDSSNTVSVQGVSTIKVNPDLASAYINIKTTEDSIKEANERNSEIFDALLIDLIREGFERDDIQTLNFNVYEEYDWTSGERKFKGYTANHNIRIIVDSGESEKIIKIIDVSSENGAVISSINFELSPEKQNEYKSEAIRLASEDARNKAESIAEGLGKEVGRLVSVSDSTFDSPVWVAYEGAATKGSSGEADFAEEARAAVSNIVPGEQQQSARVTAVFKLK